MILQIVSATYLTIRATFARVKITRKRSLEFFRGKEKLLCRALLFQNRSSPVGVSLENFNLVSTPDILEILIY